MEKKIPLHEFNQQREFSRPDSLNMPFEIARIDNLAEKNQPAAPHRHTYYEIFWIIDGGGTHYVDFEGYPFLPNTFFFITPGQIHYPEITKELSGFVILFTDDFLLMNRVERNFLRDFDFFHRIDHTPTLRLKVEDAQLFHTICADMHKEYNSDAFGRLVVLQSLLQNFLVQIQRHYYKTDTQLGTHPTKNVVQNLIRLIDSHFIEQQTVQDYADLLGVTAGHLSDMTSEVLGLSPSKLIHQRLIVEAKRLFAHSNQTVTEISYQLNFADPSYFARFFKRETGFSPTQFKSYYREKYLHYRSS